MEMQETTVGKSQNQDVVSPLQSVKLSEGSRPTVTLSEILEANPDPKYFLSDKAMAYLKTRMDKNVKDVPATPPSPTPLQPPATRE